VYSHTSIKAYVSEMKTVTWFMVDTLIWTLCIVKLEVTAVS
jgi:hypothetical protein